MKKALLFLSMLLLSHLSANSANGLDGVTVSNVKVPFYQKGALQSMIFANKAEYRAQLLYGHNVIINMLQKKVNPDRIRNDWDLQLYPLESSLADVIRFWAARASYCDAVIFTPEGVLNQTERTATGDREVKLRSPLVDLDGVGFASDFKRRQLKVNSKVRIIMRGKNCDPRLLKGKVPARYEFIRGTSDMLHMDTARRRLMLLGKVTVIDRQVKLTCDRLTVDFGGNSKTKEKSSTDFSGIRMLYADGHVRVEKLLPAGASVKESRVLTGDHLVYDVPRGQLTVTGDKKQPELQSGGNFTLRGKELIYFRDKQQLIVPAECWMRLEEKGEKRYLMSDYGNFNFSTGICDFLGHVRGSAPQHELACSKMRVTLERSSAVPPKSTPKAKSDSLLSGTGEINTGSLEFKRAQCKENVKIFRREQSGFSTLSSDEADLNYATDKVLFTGNVKCVSGGNTLETRRLTVNLKPSAANPRNKDIENAFAEEGVKITGTPDEKKEKSVLTADRGIFNYNEDRVKFSGNVCSTRGKSRLTCDHLEMYLEPQKSGDKPVSIPGVASGASGRGKTLKRIVASGNANMQDESNGLEGDNLEFYFTPALPGAPNRPGMFQSGSLRLIKVTGDGHVKLTSQKNAEPQIPDSSDPVQNSRNADAGVMLGRNAGFRELTSDTMVADLKKYTTLFTGKVAVTDGSSRMNCEKLELFAKLLPQGAAAAAATAAANSDPDADPFDLPAENSVPSTIALGNGLALDRSEATEDVVINRRPNAVEPGETIYCDRAEFKSSSMTIECTSLDGKRPKAVSSGKTHSADKFTIFLKDERIESSGDTTLQ
ncbi:MAG: hypothetical protein J6S54_06180 [Lentisphaeria bacterium]|nr:hypothetical protein [Lentisphaeria bacterium]